MILRERTAFHVAPASAWSTPLQWTALLVLSLVPLGCNAVFGVDDLSFSGGGSIGDGGQDATASTMSTMGGAGGTISVGGSGGAGGTGGGGGGGATPGCGPIGLVTNDLTSNDDGRWVIWQQSGNTAANFSPVGLEIMASSASSGAGAQITTASRLGYDLHGGTVDVRTEQIMASGSIGQTKLFFGVNTASGASVGLVTNGQTMFDFISKDDVVLSTNALGPHAPHLRVRHAIGKLFIDADDGNGWEARREWDIDELPLAEAELLTTRVILGAQVAGAGGSVTGTFAGVSGEPVGSHCPTATLSSGFDTLVPWFQVIDTDNEGCDDMVNTTGQLEVTDGDCEVRSRAGYLIDEIGVTVELVDRTLNSWAELALLDATGSGPRLRVGPDEDAFALSFDGNQQLGAFDATNWLRISRDGGEIVWAVSDDGVSWIVLATEPAQNDEPVQVILRSQSSATWDHLNVAR